MCSYTLHLYGSNVPLSIVPIRGVATGVDIGIYTPQKKSAQANFLWGKNDIRTAIQQFYTPKTFILPKTNFWLRPCWPSAGFHRLVLLYENGCFPLLSTHLFYPYGLHICNCITFMLLCPEKHTRCTSKCKAVNLKRMSYTST